MQFLLYNQKRLQCLQIKVNDMGVKTVQFLVEFTYWLFSFSQLVYETSKSGFNKWLFSLSINLVQWFSNWRVWMTRGRTWSETKVEYDLYRENKQFDVLTSCWIIFLISCFPYCFWWLSKRLWGMSESFITTGLVSKMSTNPESNQPSVTQRLFIYCCKWQRWAADPHTTEAGQPSDWNDDYQNSCN